ncbi:ADP-ribosylation factor 1 [Sesamum angolense]|uniref:ADP-ribosylation factor 1 n=1 Tax=Sesamum angolense TaxID=2727404 RepID=A0AAE1WUL2_9LAMI|nr:ADP-ribosylation factor 1 [Sesamum angolense]
MGLTFTKLFSRLFAKKEMRILMVGLDAAASTWRLLSTKTSASLFGMLVAKTRFVHCEALFPEHPRYIQSTCATSGEGLYEGLDWLSNNIANKASLELMELFMALEMAV